MIGQYQYVPAGLCVVTATTNLDRSRACRESWGAYPREIVVVNGAGNGYQGVVPAFRRGVDEALAHPNGFQIIACFHDDVEIRDPHWQRKVCEAFEANPRIGLLGFGGAVGVGDDDLYQTPYRPEQLARKGFRSNLVDAETHGVRSLRRERVACLDGFSLIGRREFFEGWGFQRYQKNGAVSEAGRPWTYLEQLGMVHHAYDGALGCLAARYGWETWYLPIACRHYGGQTAVGDPGYQAWAASQIPGGDRGFWESAHRLWYDNFRDVLPLHV